MIANRYIKATSGSSDEWVRNPNWLPMPELDGSEQCGYFLMAVFEDGENLSEFYMNEAYTVDWGDGNIEPVAAVNSSHTYEFSAISSSTEVTTTDGLTYRQVLIKITPDDGDALGTLRYRFTAGREYQYLDINWYFPNLSFTFTNTGVLPYLERFRFSNGSTPSANMLGQFANCERLQVLEIDWTKPLNIGSLQGLSVKHLGDLDLQNTTSFGMQNTYGVETIGNITMPGNISNFSNTNLRSIGNLNYQGIANLSNHLLSTHSLGGAVNITAPNCTIMNSFLQNARRLLSFSGDTPSLNSATNMFNACYSLQEIEFTDCSALATTTNIFINCYSLKKLRMPGMAKTFSVINTDIDAPNMVILFNDLADLTSLPTQTITITSTPASTELTLAERNIALNKNWTIVG